MQLIGSYKYLIFNFKIHILALKYQRDPKLN